ncbi:MAG: tetratricopeptide repeat protein [Methylophilaceae bacterium]
MLNWLIKIFFTSSSAPASAVRGAVADEIEPSTTSQSTALEFRLKGHEFFDIEDWSQAAQCYEQCIVMTPGYAADYYNLGYALWELNQPQQAKIQLLQAVALDKKLDDAYYILGDISRKQENIDEAILFFESTLATKPEFEEVLSHLGALYTQQGSIEKALDYYQRALSVNPQSENTYSNLLLTLQYQNKLSQSALFEKHKKFSEIFEAPFSPLADSQYRNVIGNRKLKIAYVSADFRKHSIALFMIPILENHDKQKFEIFCYYNHADQDEITRQIAGLADQFIPCTEMSDDQLYSRICSDEIDVLIDLSGHSGGNRLLVFARKPSPVQISYLGYIDTTGLNAMDYRLTNIDADPLGSEVYYSEKLYRFNEHLWWSYRPAANLPAITDLPAASNGYITFASTNNVAKISVEAIHLWSEILKRTPHAQLVLMGIPSGMARQRISQIFAESGVNNSRLTFHDRVTLEQYRSILLNVDITLDTFPYNGGTTTCETLSLGLPMVTLIGSSFVSRMGYALLKDIGLAELAAQNHDEYIRIATELTQNIDYLASLRKGMRSRIAKSSLCNESLFTKSLESAYIEMWKNTFHSRIQPTIN